MRRHLGQRPHCELGRGVDAEHGKAVVPGDGGSVDDLALVLALLKFLCRRLDAPQHALDIDLQYLVHFVGRDIGERLDLRDTGIVDHHVEATECFLGVLDRGIDFVAICHVCLEGGRLAAQLDDLVRYLFGLRVMDIHDGDVRAVLCQSERDGAADALACAGDKNHFSVDVHVHAPFNVLATLRPWASSQRSL